ncbi:MAG: hypothetical protein K9H61_14335 [Bacteroidia bacterium]|nr:hypothetical protein [Bacteroidia bacterium]
MLSNVKTDIKNILARNVLNYKGWSTARKIIVIESDDWGSIRMPSKDVFRLLLQNKIPVDRCPYNTNDSLASIEDLNVLFDILLAFKDKNGNHPIITANTVVANPDFEKILKSGFKQYYYEPFTETLDKYPWLGNPFKLWKEGISKKLFYPQFHGREHLNVNLWLKLLQENHYTFKKAFEFGLWGLGNQIVSTEAKINIQAAFDYQSFQEIENQKLILIDGLKLFKDIFGYSSASFIANNFTWDSSLNKTLKQCGVEIIQGMKYQKLPIGNSVKRHYLRHITGEINDFGQVYLIRNCQFEPTQFPHIDNVKSCIRDISNAFLWNKPAIINTHRLNFIGTINEKNRISNAEKFRELLTIIMKKWPNVEFMSSAELGHHILTNSVTN